MLIAQVRDDMTPKFDKGDTAFTLRSRDYKGMIAIVLSESNRKPDSKRIQQIRNIGSVERYVCDAE